MSGERHLLGVVLIVLLGFSSGNFSNETQQLFVNGSSSAARRSRRSTYCYVKNDWTMTTMVKECSGKERIKSATSDLKLGEANDDNLKNIFADVKNVDVPLVLVGSSVTQMNFGKLEESHGMIVSNNPNLESIEFPEINDFSEDGVIIEKNAKLKTIDFPKLSIVLIQKGGFEIKNNPSLSQINLGRYTNSMELKDGLVISGNRNLNQVSIQMIGKIHADVNVTIKGNRKLGKSELDKLMKLKDDTATNWDIQEPGECIFPDPMQDLVEFEDCVYVDGDLALSPAIKAGGQPVKPLRSVKGNVVIKNTNNKDLLQLFNKTKVTGNLELENNAGFCGMTAANVGNYFIVDGQKNVTNPPCPTTTSTKPTSTPLMTTQKITTAKENTTEGAANLVSGNEATTEEGSNAGAIIGGSVSAAVLLLILAVGVAVIVVIVVVRKMRKKPKDTRTESSVGAGASSANKSTASQQKTTRKSTLKNVSTSSELPQEGNENKEQKSTENTKLSMEKSQSKEQKSKGPQEKSKSKAQEKSKGPKAQEKSKGSKVQEKSKGASKEAVEKTKKSKETSKEPTTAAPVNSAEQAPPVIRNEPLGEANEWEMEAFRNGIIADPRLRRRSGNIDTTTEVTRDADGNLPNLEVPSVAESIKEKAIDVNKKVDVKDEKCCLFEINNVQTEDDDDPQNGGESLM